MTPPVKKNSPSPVGRKPNQPYTRHGEDLLSKAQEVWRKAHIPREFNIPVWYSGLHGVSNSLLRRPARKLSDREKGLTLLVRMNYILDHPHVLCADHRALFFCLNARSYRFVLRHLGPLFERAGSGFNQRWRMSTSYALQVDYNWRGALSCVLRNFVHLVWVSRNPDLALSKAFSSLEESSC